MKPLTIPSDLFDLLARGAGDTLGVLRAGQRSKRLLVLRELMAEAERRAPRLFADADAARSFAVLADAQRRAPHAVDELLLHPHVGAWMTRCLRGLLADGGTTPEDLSHVGGVAAAAALRAGQPFDLRAYPRDGSVMLPTRGAVQVAAAPGWCRLRSRRGSRGLEVIVPGTAISVAFEDAPAPGSPWHPLRRLRTASDGVAVELLLDDLDPYRGCGHLPRTGRLERAEVVDWQAKLDAAWPPLVQDQRQRAAAIATGISTIVPLQRPSLASELSATCHEAVGAAAMTSPRNPFSLALALVHEFQHTKLSALLDLVPLLRPRRQKDRYAPWRPDPRDLRGLLQGTYAYLGLTEVWDVQRRHRPTADRPGGDVAHFELALGRRQVGHAVADLRRSGGLTASGARFLEGMQARAAELARRPVPPAPGSLAELAFVDHAVSWRLRNIRPDPERVAAAARSWLAGQPCRWAGPGAGSVIDGAGPVPSDARLALMRERLAHRGLPPAEAATTPADELLVAGRHARAAEAYLVQIDQDPDDLASWAGLALARRHAPGAATSALTESPEAVYALHRAVRTRAGESPDVEALASWLAQCAPRRS